jgi:predicted nucleic acid-binding protein
VDQAHGELLQIEDFFTVVGESPEVYRAWKQLVFLHKVSGVQVHDARLVAAMKVYGITRILTFDAGDFVRYAEIDVLHPQSV